MACLLPPNPFALEHHSHPTPVYVMDLVGSAAPAALQNLPREAIRIVGAALWWDHCQVKWLGRHQKPALYCESNAVLAKWRV